MWTGPGLPPRSSPKACRSASGSMSARVGWKLRFTYGRMAFTKSPWK